MSGSVGKLEMTDTHSTRWLLDLELPIPFHEQIKGQITYAIVYRELESGMPLPSVREMASLLKVFMMPVSSVYREMISRIDVIVYASGSESILQWVPENVETIERRMTCLM
jgi:DNA-binding transcriptional regulator YhcF (GntR family)